MASITQTQQRPDDLPPALILFDGVCGLCDRSVNFIIDHDAKGHFHFAALQSALGKRILSQQAPTLGALASVVLLENGKPYFRSTAALRILRQLPGPWWMLGWLAVLPAGLRDRVYDWIARHRYGWFGKVEACRLPEASVAERFLSL